MISSFKLRFGPSASSAPLNVDTTPITVFVGPNNSGKSRILSEIEQHCQHGIKQHGCFILDDLEFMSTVSLEATDAAISRIRLPTRLNESLPVDHIIVGSKRGRTQTNLIMLRSVIQNPKTNPQYFAQNYLNHAILKLDGQSRIALVNQQPAGDLQAPNHNTLSVLFTDDQKRFEVRRIVNEAFGTHFVIDPTFLGNFRIRLSDRAPSTIGEERGIDSAAVTFHSKAQPIEAASDGVKAFTGIITEVIAGDPGILLIDEPEAFLHPSLAFKLGLEIARASAGTNKRLFVSTHSPSFLMGCIQAGIKLNIVRLTYRGGTATARILPSAEIVSLMRNPLLRSTNIMSGLFAEFVIVTEADADRAFYQEINERLLRYKPEYGVPNCLFLHAQNKQTIPTILNPLRRLGIPAAAITDVDVLKEGGTNWANLLQAAGLPEIEKGSLATMRTALKSAMDATGRDMKKEGGIEILNGEELEAAKNLLERLAAYGVFIVPTGELESWLKPLGATGHGPTWLIRAFELMGEDPEHSSYLKPAADDVWKFLSDVRIWLTNPVRKGVPV